MKVIAVTNQNGYDVNQTEQSEYEADGKDKKLLPSTITVIANEQQSAILAQLEADTRVHVSLIYRGNDDAAKKFLDEQDKVFAETDETAESDETDKTAATSETSESLATTEKVVTSELSPASHAADYEDLPDLEDVTGISE
jgi:pilus assembly protein CpaB